MMNNAKIVLLSLSLSLSLPFTNISLVYDDDVGFDDKLGGCTIDLEKMNLNEEPTDVEKVIDNKKGAGWFSKKAKIYLEITFTQPSE